MLFFEILLEYVPKNHLDKQTFTMIIGPGEYQVKGSSMCISEIT